MPPFWIVILALAPYLESWEVAPVSVEMSVPKTEINVSETFQVKISATVPKLGFEAALEKARDRDYKAMPPADQLTRLENVSLREIQMDSSMTAGTVTQVWTFILEPLVPGESQIPPLTLTFESLDPEKEDLQVQTEAVPLLVAAVISDPSTATLKDPAAQISRPMPSVLKWFLIVLVLAVWVCWRFGLWKFRKNRATEVSLGESRHPGRFALEELERTEKPATVHRILRRAMLDAFDLDISALSEPNLLQSKQLPQEAEIELVEILRELEPAIYAKNDAPISDALKARIRKFIETHLPS